MDIIWAVSYLAISELAHHHRVHISNATPQCMVARYSFEWLGDH